MASSSSGPGAAAVDLRPQWQEMSNGNSRVLQSSDDLSEELEVLLRDSLREMLSFTTKAHHERSIHRAHTSLPKEGSALIHSSSFDPETLELALGDSLKISDDGTGAQGLQTTLEDILNYSVNPAAPGFMDKLYSAPLAPGIAAEMALAFLNTNVHVYQVSPVLTLVEKTVTKRLAKLFGLDAPRAGGIVVTGGSASNLTSMIVARNSLFPETKVESNAARGRKLVMFTSAHGHYSIEKAAQGLGFGSSAVIAVPTDEAGRMSPEHLDRLITEAKNQGHTPFYINATAGSTVLGSFDPFEEISRISRKHRCWFHVDGAWGGSFVFSQRKSLRDQLLGTHLADSIAINPHKMLGVPLTCSILLGRDLRLFQQAMTLKAPYLFHEIEEESAWTAEDDQHDEEDISGTEENGVNTNKSLYDLRDEPDRSWTEPMDLADMTLQCGRRGDSLKFFMSWQYYGTYGYARKIDSAYDIALYMNARVDQNPNLTLVLGPGSKPSCLQVCFYYTPDGKFVFGLVGKDEHHAGLIKVLNATSKRRIGKLNSRVTSQISKSLIPRGFMVDFAPALESQEDKGHFLRVVVNISTIRETVDRLLDEISTVGESVVTHLKEQFQ